MDAGSKAAFPLVLDIFPTGERPGSLSTFTPAVWALLVTPPRTGDSRSYSDSAHSTQILLVHPIHSSRTRPVSQI